MKLRMSALVALALPLAACVSFGEKVPPTLMTLTAATPLAAGPARTVDPARTVQINVPSVSPSLATQRVPVRASDTSIAYLKDAQWAEQPNRLFRSLLAEVVAQRTGRTVLDLRQLAIPAGARLTGTLAAFGLDAAAGAVVVTYDATLTRGDAPGEVRRFEARMPATPDPASVAQGLNQAANKVASDVADWVGQ